MTPIRPSPVGSAVGVDVSLVSREVDGQGARTAIRLHADPGYNRVANMAWQRDISLDEARSLAHLLVRAVEDAEALAVATAVMGGAE